MKKRTIKKRFNKLDELAMPAKEKMLPSEALSKANTPFIEKRRLFPQFATASIAVVMLIVVSVAVIGGVTSSHSDNSNRSDPFDNSMVAGIDKGEESPYKDVSTNKGEESTNNKNDVPKTNLPIVSCGKYDAFSDDCVHFVPYGEVAIGAMTGGCLGEVDKLQHDVLYAVYFSADPVGYGSYFAQTEYNKGLRRIEAEKQEKYNVEAEKTLNYLKENEKEKYEDMLKDFEHRIEVYPSENDYDGFRNFVLDYMYYSSGTGNLPEWFKPIDLRLGQLWEECEDKKFEYERIARENANAKMYEYLDSLGIKFYDKTVYVYNSMSEEKEILSERVYRVAFLTKDEIKSLKGGEDYGIRVVQVFEEMAKQDNEPVYLQPWFVDD